MMGDAGERVHRGLADVYFDNTSITEIRGDQGRLIHRGYDIEALAADPCYEQVAYLLINGELPADDQARSFRAELCARRALPPGVIGLLERMTDQRPDIVLRTMVAFLGGGADDEKPEDWALIALLPSIIVAHHALRSGRPIPPPRADADLACDFLSRLLQRPLSELEQHIINLVFVLHADHGANASSFAARVATGTEADVCAAVSAAIATFGGPRHGGAVAGVARMLDELGTPEAAKAHAERYRPGGGIMGFGHPVYPVEDPRARLFRKAARELSDRLGDRRLLDTLDALVEGMAAHRRFDISPNVDLYAALVYRLLGLPDDLSIAVFAAARTAGWIAQIREQRANNILIRPLMLNEESKHSSAP